MANEFGTPVGNVVDMTALLAIRDLPILVSQKSEQEKPKQEKSNSVVVKKKK